MYTPLDDATLSVVKQIEKENLLNSLVDEVGTRNYFASVIGCHDGYIATAVDGVGSKIKHLIKNEMYDVIGKDCFAMCYNDLICVGANPISFSDHITATKEHQHILPKVISGITEYCKESFSLLSGGETEILKETNFHISGSMVGTIADRNQMIDGSKVSDGDIIVGLDSSGIHANGWTAIAERMPQLIEPNNLTATRLYNKLFAVFSQTREISGLVHITGGGFRNLERIPQNLQYNIRHEPKLRLFQALGTEFTQLECYTTFNMGIGMIVITKPEGLDTVLEVYDGEAQVLGMVTKSERPRVVVNTMELGTSEPYPENEEKEKHELEYSLTDN